MNIYWFLPFFHRFLPICQTFLGDFSLQKLLLITVYFGYLFMIVCFVCFPTRSYAFLLVRTFSYSSRSPPTFSNFVERPRTLPSLLLCRYQAWRCVVTKHLTVSLLRICHCCSYLFLLCSTFSISNFLQLPVSLLLYRYQACHCAVSEHMTASPPSTLPSH